MPEKALRISIPSPCQQSWEAMPEKGAGRYCGQCSKVILDFTKLSDAELIRFFTSKHSAQLCGTFSPQQLERTYTLTPVQPRSPATLKLMLAGLLSLPLLSPAQTPPPKTGMYNEQLKKTPVQTRYIKGKVIDRSSKKGIAAEIRLYSNRLDTIEHSTFRADSNGHYELVVPYGAGRFFKLVYTSGTHKERTVVVDRDHLPQWLAVSLTLKPVAYNEWNNEVVVIQDALRPAESISVPRIMGASFGSMEYVTPRRYKRIWHRLVRFFRRY